MNFEDNDRSHEMKDKVWMNIERDQETSRFPKTWKIMIADDEKEVHTVTKMVLKNCSFEGKPLEFISAYSGCETKKLIAEHPDCALILLDVVMEDDDSGLEVVKYIREVQKNLLIRIILRTGQSGQAPEREVINNYDINDYKEKTELTFQKLYTTIMVGLRNHRDLLMIEESKDKVENIKQYLSHIIQSMPSGILVINADYHISLCNELLGKFIELKKGDVLGENLFEVAAFFRVYQKDIAAAFYSKQIQKKVMVTTEKGKIANILFYPVESSHQPQLVIRMDDVSELKERDLQIMRMQKLELMGTLAAGLAHDFNNVLGGISGTVSLMRLEEMDKTGGNLSLFQNHYLEYLDTIDVAVARAANTVKKLLSLSKKEVDVFTKIDLNDVITNVLRICSSTFPKSIKISVESCPEKAIVNGDSAQLEQAFFNLCINACHAMTIMRGSDEGTWGGELTVSISRLEKKDLFYPVYPNYADSNLEKEYYLVSVSDTGVGIDASLKQKIFDPFFSTKKKEEGNGLGLLMVYNITRNHGGCVDVVSELAKGTVFKVYLPAAKDCKSP